MLRSVAFQRTQLCAKNSQLFKPEIPAQTSTNESLFVEHS